MKEYTQGSGSGGWEWWWHLLGGVFGEKGRW